MRVLRQVVISADGAVGEIATPASGDPDPLAELFGMIDQQHASTAHPGLGSAHHAGRAGADDDDVEMHGSPIGENAYAETGRILSPEAEAAWPQ